MNVPDRKVYRLLSSRPAYHLYFWGFFFIGFLLQSLKERSFVDSITYTSSIIALLIIPVYLNFFVLDRLFHQKKYYLYSLSLCVIILISAIIMDNAFILLFQEWPMLVNRIITVSVFIVLTSAIKFAKIGFDQKLAFQEMKTKQLQTELNLLKAQINPHFLFNTLNNLYGLARKNDSGTADGIARLSHLMRYMIYDSDVEEISLEKEVAQIKHLIDLHSLRFLAEDDIDISFKTNGNIEQINIPPMLLIPFVENAFKHGISISNKSFIHIYLEVQDEHLFFSVKNSIHHKNTDDDDQKHGVGLKNVKRRLEILFPNRFNLDIQEDKISFEAHLKLVIKI